jgi:hypothetical protein
MAATSTFPSAETSPVVNDSVGAQQTHQLLGVRTDVHAMPTGMGRVPSGDERHWRPDLRWRYSATPSSIWPTSMCMKWICCPSASGRTHTSRRSVADGRQSSGLLRVPADAFAFTTAFVALVENRDILAREVAARRGNSAGTQWAFVQTQMQPLAD